MSVTLCLCVRDVKGKRLELSTPNLVDIQCIAVDQHVLTLRSKVKVICTASMGLHVDRTAYVFQFSEFLLSLTRVH